MALRGSKAVYARDPFVIPSEAGDLVLGRTSLPPVRFASFVQFAEIRVQIVGAVPMTAARKPDDTYGRRSLACSSCLSTSPSLRISSPYAAQLSARCAARARS